MKLKLLLALSVTLNIVAAACLIALNASLSSPKASSPPPIATSVPSPSESPTRTEQQPLKPAISSGVSWVQVLRDGGISEKLIADVAAANFEDRWHKLALENQKKFDRGEIDQAALTRFDFEHDAEQEKELRAQLGEEGFHRWDQARLLADFDRTGVELSADENEQVYALRKELDRNRLNLDLARHDGKIKDSEASAQSEEIYAQYNQQLLMVLGRDRYAQTQSGGDTGVGELKRNLQGIGTNDSQFAGMQTALQNWNAQRSELDLELQEGNVTADNYQKQLKTLEAQRDQEYQKVLGTNGFASFQRNQNEQYQSLQRIGPDIGFSDDDINNLYASIQDYQNSVNDYRDRAQILQDQGQTVDWTAVQKALSDFSQQTETALRNQLGDKFDKLKRSNVLPFER
jgi:hypothetical protein